MALDYGSLARNVGLKFSECAAHMCQVYWHFKGKKEGLVSYTEGHLASMVVV